ncbi:MAG: DedA family protein [Patescibacteria group bacterium]
MFSSLVNTILDIFSQIGYGGIVVLMAIESSILPLPSEIVIPPAAYLAADGRFNIILIILAGAIGSVIGALINYALAYYLGRPVVYRLASTKWARFILVTPEKIKKAEDLFLTRGRSATFIGRLFPVVRHLISIPAGFSKMPLRPFITYTFLGSFLWVSILAVLGYFLGANKELLEEYYTGIFWTLIIICSLSLVYVYYHRRRKKNN